MVDNGFYLEFWRLKMSRVVGNFYDTQYTDNQCILELAIDLICGTKHRDISDQVCNDDRTVDCSWFFDNFIT